MSDNEMLAYSILKASLDYRLTCETALDEVLRKVCLSKESIDRIGATGVGRGEIACRHQAVTEITAEARGSVFLIPKARTIIDVGAEAARVIRCDRTGKVIGFARNDKCAAGVGTFIESMARALEIDVEDIGPLSLKFTRKITMNSTCVVFAESEVVSLIHDKISKPDIAAAIHEAITTRIASMVMQLGSEKEVVFIGGVAKNIGVVERLKKHLSIDLQVPKEPQVVAALGAALVARD